MMMLGHNAIPAHLQVGEARLHIDRAFRVQREIFYETGRPSSGGDQSTKNVFAVCDRKAAREALCARGNEVYYLVSSIEP
jgi:hypothetical protein